MGVRAVAILILTSVVGWLAAALFIKMTSPLGWYDGGLANLVLFVASLPVAFAMVEILRHLVAPGSATIAAALLTTPALVLDGLALTWLPSLYGNHPAGPTHGSTWLLLGVGAILAVALWRDLSVRRA